MSMSHIKCHRYWPDRLGINRLVIPNKPNPQITAQDHFQDTRFNYSSDFITSERVTGIKAREYHT